jgi:hypothetical protein
MTLSHTEWVAVTADWSEHGEYMLARHGIHPAWANETLDDPDRLGHHARPGEQVRSGSAHDRLVVHGKPDHHRDHARRQRPASWRERMGGEQQ